MSYKRFLLMISTSVLVMYLAMYLNNYAWDHVFWSETRAYMSLIMGAVMATVMLLFMIDKYPNKKINGMIFVGSAILFVASLFLVRSQSTIDDVSWMKGMIPHHSIAILPVNALTFLTLVYVNWQMKSFKRKRKKLMK